MGVDCHCSEHGSASGCPGEKVDCHEGERESRGDVGESREVLDGCREGHVHRGEGYGRGEVGGCDRGRKGLGCFESRGYRGCGSTLGKHCGRRRG